MTFFICKLTLLSTIIIFTSCHDFPKSNDVSRKNLKEWKIPLDNNLGTISISLSDNFDTLFKWTQYSDCGDPCAHTNYRVQPKNFPVFKESGFYYKSLKDSVYQFTIKHAKITFVNPTNDTLVLNHYTHKLKDEAFENLSGKYLIDTLITLNKKPFSVIAFTSIDTTNNAIIQILNAITSIHGNLIEFYFENKMIGKDFGSKEFIQNSLAALKTISFPKN
jgi:hypothetical protein